MIVLAAAMMMAASAPPSAPSRERTALGSCLRSFVHDKLTTKLDSPGFKTAAKTACATQAAAFRAAWVTYDVAMRTPRTDAEQNADSQINDYLENSFESYTDATTPQQPKTESADAAVKPASSTTPPKN